MFKKIQLIEKEVPAANATVRLTEELDNDYRYLTGIALLDNIGLKSVLGYSSIDGQELFPKNFEAAFLQSNVFVAPDQRFFTLYNQKAQGKKLEIEFKDGGTAAAYPYTLRIYLRLENDKD
tara:strand:+ start:178 stop:540 length:363 start_codon:yes stop_codon:yes gene_type:complete